MTITGDDVMQIISRNEATTQGLKWYFTGKPCKHGHVAKRLVSNRSCAECSLEKTRAWASSNKDHLRAEARRWRESNRERRREYNSRWYAENQSHKREYDRKWAETNREHKRQRDRAYSKRRRKEDPRYVMMRRIRGMLERLIYNHGISKDSDTCTTLGYTVDDLQRHLERQFIKGMTWANYGEWHIDHIVPVIEHIRNGETDPAVINCLTNLRPMWAKDNLRKSDTRTHLL